MKLLDILNTDPKSKQKEPTNVNKSVGGKEEEENIGDLIGEAGAGLVEVGLDKRKGSQRERKFQDNWTKTYTWLSYDSKRQRVFFQVCVSAINQGLPKPTTARHLDSYQYFVVNGFGNWKKALETFRSHEKSDLHRASIAVFTASGKEKVSNLLEAGKLKQMKRNIIALVAIFTGIRYLGRQGLAAGETATLKCYWTKEETTFQN
eukprot:gene17101-8618_t